jgi:hypothetical protein
MLKMVHDDADTFYIQAVCDFCNRPVDPRDAVTVFYDGPLEGPASPLEGQLKTVHKNCCKPYTDAQDTHPDGEWVQSTLTQLAKDIDTIVRAAYGARL